MNNKKNPPSEFYKSFADEITGKFRRISHLVRDARAASGSYHESILRSTIRNFLSDRFSVKTGYIYLDQEHVSPQIDIMIIDEYYPFTYLYRDGEFAIVRPQAVCFVMEVKTVMKTSSFFSNAFCNIAEAKKLKYETQSGSIIGSVFAYESSNLTNEKLGKWFADQEVSKWEEEVKSSYWPNSIFFFSDGLYLWLDTKHQFDPSNKKTHYYKFYQRREKKSTESDASWQLSILLASVVEACSAAEFARSHMFPTDRGTQLIDFSKAERSLDRFRPKDGHSRST